MGIVKAREKEEKMKMEKLTKRQKEIIDVLLLNKDAYIRRDSFIFKAYLCTGTHTEKVTDKMFEWLISKKIITNLGAIGNTRSFKWVLTPGTGAGK